MEENKKIQHKIDPGSIGYFNLLRGLGILLVIAGHSYTMVLQYIELPEVVSKAGLFSGWGQVFGAGIMAMLFLISGYGFFKRRPKKCWSIQKDLLLIPYFAVGISVVLAKILLAILERRSFMEHGGEFVLTYLLGLNYYGGGTLFGLPVNSIGLFWFVLALLVGWNLYNAISQIKDERRKIILVTCGVLVGYGMTCASVIWPYSIHIGFLVTGYLAVGEEVRKKDWLSRKIPIWQWIALMGISVVCLAFGRCDMGKGIWKLGLLDVLGTYCIALLMLRFYAAIMDFVKQNAFVRFAENVGRASIYIISIHSFETVIFPWYKVGIFCGMKYGVGSSLHLLMGTLSILVLRSIVIFVIYQIVMKIMKIKKKRKKKRKKRNRSNVG